MPSQWRSVQIGRSNSCPPTVKISPTALAFALRYQGRKRVPNADEIMAEIVARRFVGHLDRAGFVAMKRPADIGAGRSRGATPQNPSAGKPASHHSRKRFRLDQPQDAQRPHGVTRRAQWKKGEDVDLAETRKRYDSFQAISREFINEVDYRCRSACRALDLLTACEGQNFPTPLSHDELTSLRFILVRFAILELSALITDQGNSL